MSPAVKAAQIHRLNKRIISCENAHLALGLQIEADLRSVVSLAKLLDTVKRDQASQRAESMAQHEN